MRETARAEGNGTHSLPGVPPTMGVVAVIERPIQFSGWAFVGTFARVQFLT